MLWVDVGLLLTKKRWMMRCKTIHFSLCLNFRKVAQFGRLKGKKNHNQIKTDNIISIAQKNDSSEKFSDNYLKWHRKWEFISGIKLMPNAFNKPNDNWQNEHMLDLFVGACFWLENANAIFFSFKIH